MATRLLPRAALLAAVALPLASTAPAQAEPPASCPIVHPKYSGDSPRFQRASIDVGGVQYRYTVLLPSGYDTSSRRFPVLYLFHGGGGFEESFMVTEDGKPPLIETISAADPVIIVMPDGGFIGGHSDWPDDPEQQWETFHVKHLVPHVDRTYRTIPSPSRRAVMGFSMGGFGAMSYAARHPGVFGAAGSASGFLDTSRRNPDMQAALLPIILFLRPLCTNSQAPFGPWGDPVTGADEWERHNPTALAERLRGTLLYAASADGVPCDMEQVEALATHVVPNYTYAIEPQLRAANRTFRDTLSALGIPLVYREWPCGIHDGRAFESALREWWPIMLRFFADSGQPAASPRIRLAVKPRRARSGRRARFRLSATAVVDGTRRPLSGVRVRLGHRRATTGPSGRATVSVVPRSGRARCAIARKPGFRPGRACITLRSSTRRTSH